MGIIKEPEPVKLIIGIISNNIRLFDKASDELEKMFGAIDFKSQVLAFDKTTYYQSEMGLDLKRQFFSFSKCICPDKLPNIKTATNDLEFQLSGTVKQRSINLDPGYVNLGKVVLATTKDHQHRLYLGKGIYGEVTLRYRNKTFAIWEWTYPDYASQEYIQIFNEIRCLYHKQIISMGKRKNE